jgi:outer membrane protein assembly factor BamA
MTRNFFRTWLFVSACAYASAAAAQQARPEPSDGGSSGGFLDRTLSWAAKTDASTEGKDGVYPEFGGFINGAGVSVGPGFRHHVFGDRAIVDASAAMSWRRYTMMQSRLEWPRLMGDRLSVGGQVKYQDFTQINFFGIGGDSLKSNRTDYRLKSFDALGFATLRADKWLSISGRAGLLRNVNVERGTSSLYPSTGDVFDEATAPALAATPTYIHAEVAVEGDTRDVPDYPSNGGRYRISVATYHDRDFGRYSFRRLEADASQYVSIFNPRMVLAVRARVDLTDTAPGQTAAFYMLPTLGGSRSLRGYLDYRFRDRDALLLNGDYRFPLARILDGAVFYDAGAVAPSAGELSGRRLMTDYGVGVRVHSKKHLLFRVDLARGREGNRVSATFSTPFGTSQSIVPYEP